MAMLKAVTFLIFFLIWNAEGRTDPTVKIHVTTFNVGGITPPQSFCNWLVIDPADPPDLIVVGLQEMVELDVPHMVVGSFKEDKWIYAFRKNIPEDYNQIEYVRLVGVFLIVYKRVDAKFSVSDVSKSKVGTGIMKFGNKGGAGISMKINDMTVCIVNCHLAAGQSDVKKRNLDFQSISQKLKFSGDAKTVYDHDLIIWMGDMNSRLTTDIPRNEVVDKCQKGDHELLIQYDQLREERLKGNIFKDFHEMLPKFRPTYKFDVGTSNYDTGPKKRLPAWCDRILHWKKNDNTDIKQISYTSRHNVVLSDHKPVQALFELTLPVN
jgi:hypothetical protein